MIFINFIFCIILNNMNEAILQFSCPDKPGIVAKLSNLFFKHNINIISASQFSSDYFNGDFFLRMKISSYDTSFNLIQDELKSIALSFSGQFNLFSTDQPLKVSILVSKTDHCLKECLYRYKSGDLPIHIDSIISNHDCHQDLCAFYNVPFHFLPVTKSNKQEDKILGLTQNTNLIILARYMQVLSPNFLASYSHDIINIHHSFLPSFKGANPYLQAFEKGVKIIGATAHFVTEDLDEGPIISQNISSISHKHTISEIKQKSQILEKTTLADTIKLYAEHRIFKYKNKTIIFD
ncbi:formyltetrahydrofolate deformylase [Candidatus Marinamargulisbacteria bacterium SCGC AG-410-N11]|nr:formyltetrahydrofolate deformylase [Candidatus Marinamargulisbacteria bacterium SCGC AG-410-N11]